MTPQVPHIFAKFFSENILKIKTSVWRFDGRLLAFRTRGPDERQVGAHGRPRPDVPQPQRGFQEQNDLVSML
jgi:hypothetical protein